MQMTNYKMYTSLCAILSIVFLGRRDKSLSPGEKRVQENSTILRGRILPATQTVSEEPAVAKSPLLHIVLARILHHLHDSLENWTKIM